MPPRRTSSRTHEAKCRYTTSIDREYVQKEIGWAQQYNKNIIILYEPDQRRPNYFDFTEARNKYKGTAYEYLLGIAAIPFQRDQFLADAMLRNILAKASTGSIDAAADPLNDPGWWDFFLSHHQALGGDQMKTLSVLFEREGRTAWYDNRQLDKSERAMEEGVKHCKNFVLMLTADAYAARATCKLRLHADVATVPPGSSARENFERGFAEAIASLTYTQLQEQLASYKGKEALEAWLEDCGLEDYADQVKVHATSLLTLCAADSAAVQATAEDAGMTRLEQTAFINNFAELSEEIEQLKKRIRIQRLLEGSVIVVFEILPPTDDTQPAAEWIAGCMQTIVASGTADATVSAAAATITAPHDLIGLIEPNSDFCVKISDDEPQEPEQPEPKPEPEVAMSAESPAQNPTPALAPAAAATEQKLPQVIGDTGLEGWIGCAVCLRAARGHPALQQLVNSGGKPGDKPIHTPDADGECPRRHIGMPWKACLLLRPVQTERTTPSDAYWKVADTLGSGFRRYSQVFSRGRSYTGQICKCDPGCIHGQRKDKVSNVWVDCWFAHGSFEQKVWKTKCPDGTLANCRFGEDICPFLHAANHWLEIPSGVDKAGNTIILAGAVIGPERAHIRKIQQDTGVDIDIWSDRHRKFTACDATHLWVAGYPDDEAVQKGIEQIQRHFADIQQRNRPLQYEQYNDTAGYMVEAPNERLHRLLPQDLVDDLITIVRAAPDGQAHAGQAINDLYKMNAAHKEQLRAFQETHPKL
eukprot:COSAG02_NODE_5785_length_4036_cov_3.068834_3_plen_756_part_01